MRWVIKESGLIFGPPCTATNQVIPVCWRCGGISPWGQPQLRVAVKRHVETYRRATLHDEVGYGDGFRLRERVSSGVDVLTRPPPSTARRSTLALGWHSDYTTNSLINPLMGTLKLQSNNGPLYQFMWIWPLRRVDRAVFVFCTKFGSNICYSHWDRRTFASDLHLMSSRELTSGFEFWSRGHLRVAVVHLFIQFDARYLFPV